MGQSFTYLGVGAPLVGQSVGGDAVGQSHGVLLWGRAPLMGHSPTYGSELYILGGRSPTCGSHPHL